MIALACSTVTWAQRDNPTVFGLRCGTVRDGYVGRTGDGAESQVACPAPGCRWCSCAPVSQLQVWERTRVLPGERVILAQNFLKIVDVCSVESKEN